MITQSRELFFYVSHLEKTVAPSIHSVLFLRPLMYPGIKSMWTASDSHGRRIGQAVAGCSGVFSQRMI
jgi:hypothetical protein